MDEQAVDEFIQKFEAEVNQHTASVNSTNKTRHQMVKTSVNKGARNIYLITSNVTANSQAIAELNRFLRLAQGVVINLLILKEDKQLANA